MRYSRVNCIVLYLLCTKCRLLKERELTSRLLTLIIFTAPFWEKKNLYVMLLVAARALEKAAQFA